VDDDADAAESEHERVNRNLDQLLQELRVALPGVQVLFAFLLAVPFATGWRNISDADQRLYFGTLLLSMAASALLIAPTIQHRLLFRFEDKRWLVESGSRLTIAGLACLALAMQGALLLVAHVMFGWPTAIVATAASSALFALFWGVLPISRRLRGKHSNLTPGDP
jgi:hypothetical protein